MKESPSYKILESCNVPQLSSSARLSDYAPGVFKSLPSKKATKKAIKEGLVLVNGKRGYSGDFVLGGELLELLQGEGSKMIPQLDLDIEVCYEDQYLAVVNKPAGLLVSGNKHRTLENALSGNIGKSNLPDALDKPEPIHRLDFPTSGALLVGKTRQAVIALNKVFEERKIVKKYLAVAIGEMEPQGVIETEVDGKKAKSEYKVISSAFSERFGFLNMVELTLFTGRRHQLRIHLSSIGNPILGDSEHGIEGKILKGKGLYLHSHSLEFGHPFTHETIKVEVNPPKKVHKLFV